MSEKELQYQIEELNKQLQMQNSLQRNFFMAMLRGFAGAVGATVVFGIVLAFLFQIIRSINYVPILNNILNSGAIEEVVKRFTQPPV